MGKKLYRPRLIQKLWAHFAGYFWLPCPICGKEFGGHEWGRWNYATYPRSMNSGTGICDDCAPIGAVMWKNKGVEFTTEEEWK